MEDRTYIQCIPAWKDYVGKLTVSCLGENVPQVKVTKESGTLWHITAVYELQNEVVQDDCFAELIPAGTPERYWISHLTPEEGAVADQHVFRTPAAAAIWKTGAVILLPDVETYDRQQARSYLDMDAQKGFLCYGMSDNVIYDHVLYRKVPGTVWRSGTVTLSFYLMIVPTSNEGDYLRPVLEFYWSRYGSADYHRFVAMKSDLTPFVKRTYDWAFGSWKHAVWQEFELYGKQVGAPAFIVNVSQSPNYPGVPFQREMLSVWNQAWFCSLRSASGLFRYARRTNNAQYLKYAQMTKELALSFPQKDGLFDSIIATEMTKVNIGGKDYDRALGWDTKYFGNSNRNPLTWDIRRSPKHILDMSFTAYYMLIWYRDLEPDTRLTSYAGTYADKLLALQRDDGFFPAWLDDNGRSIGVLDDSPETSMSSAFLTFCYRTFGDKKYLDGAVRAMEAVCREVIPEDRYEDFETYWSCCQFHSYHVGEKIARNGMYKQCNFSMYFTALALLELYEATGAKRYLTIGQAVLDRMLILQSSFQPRAIIPPVVGGFGVMNADGELNDSRQSLFAELIYRYGKVTENREYIERALAALRISFSMMYCPENPEIMEQWEIAHPFFGENDYGFTMENYCHNGRVDGRGIGIGVFTIYDWGNGAAAEAFERMLDHYGNEILN